MSTDFFDDLERQLVAATPQRAGRIRRARRRQAAATAGALLVLLVGGAGIATAVGNGDGGGRDDADAPAGPTRASTPAVTTRTTQDPPARKSYTVALLNGTTVPALARAAANRLQDDGFRVGNVTNAATQDQATTAVYYRTTDCIPAASDVAAALRLADARGEFALRKMTPGLRAIAGRQADVVVVVGSDQNRPAGP